MNEKKSNVPKLRFPGFTDTWEQRKAIEIFKSTVDKGHSHLPVLSATQGYGMVLREDTGINISHDKKNEATYKRVLPGQFVIHLRSFQGGFAHANVEGITSPAYTVMGFVDKDRHDDYFWKYVLSSEKFIKSLEKVTYGIRDGRSISYNDFSEMQFLCPLCQEQKAVGMFFTILDNLITLHQRKLEHLQEQKKGLLQKMFPKDGADVPEIRFPGYTDAWEQRKAVDIAPLQRGFDLPKNQMKDGKYPVVMSNGINGYHTEYKAKAPGVVTGRSGTIGNLHYISSNYWPHNTTLWVTDFKENNPLYVFYMYQRLGLDRYGTGSGVPTLNRNDVHDARIYIPKPEEQANISDFFATLDNLITLHQRKLEHLQEQKKGLLQQMFI